MRQGEVLWTHLAGLAQALAVDHASAQRAPANPPDQVPQPRDCALDLLLAGQASLYDSLDMKTDGALVGGTLLARYALLSAGLSLGFGGALFEERVVAASLLGGWSWQTELGPRLELFGILGVDGYHAEKSGVFSDDPGTSAALGFGGVRVALWHRFAPRRNAHLIAGVFGSYEQDFTRVTRRYGYLESSFLFSHHPTELEREYTFGDRRLALGASFGLLFDLR